MLRKRSRAVGGGQQGRMLDLYPLSSPIGSSRAAKATASSLFPPPRLFGAGLSWKALSEPEAAMSPTSILESKHFSIGSLLFGERKQKKPPCESAADGAPAVESKNHLRANADARAVSHGILDALDDEETAENYCSPHQRMVLFGPKLHVQIPSITPVSMSPAGSMEFPNSPIEFGIKNRDSQLALLSPARKSLGVDMAISSAALVFTGSITASEMELSEDYTCVITHGPNPKTTHIFDNFILESFGDGFTTALRKDMKNSETNSNCDPLKEFLSHCCACKKHLGRGEDIYIYRGDKAFCSSECRYQEMLLDEKLEECSESHH